ncbi:FkbM family methyltransferase [Luteolibacter marinus]|uniref:FkbM family methyltransferase n=1 Tax=Luteolibacter marinus TaxID=2776705 RepID=UPI001867B682|nr:FkbM family methyltransferase [Luteolibacter marinus]
MKGLAERQSELAQIYLQNLVDISEDEIVLDCGAHIGEFGLHCSRKGAKVFAFEPDPTEFRALKINSKDTGITPINRALAATSGILDFYDANNKGDSSLFNPGNDASHIRVNSTTLDSFLSEYYPEGPIKHLKLEAEGAEPEILEGARGSLKRFHYIAAAGGPERGISHETTLAKITERLHDNGFPMIGFGARYYVGLSKNKSI